MTPAESLLTIPSCHSSIAWDPGRGPRLQHEAHDPPRRLRGRGQHRVHGDGDDLARGDDESVRSAGSVGSDWSGWSDWSDESEQSQAAPGTRSGAPCGGASPRAPRSERTRVRASRTAAAQRATTASRVRIGERVAAAADRHVGAVEAVEEAVPVEGDDDLHRAARLERGRRDVRGGGHAGPPADRGLAHAVADPAADAAPAHVVRRECVAVVARDAAPRRSHAGRCTRNSGGAGPSDPTNPMYPMDREIGKIGKSEKSKIGKSGKSENREK
eukprot:gene12818-biopygen9048